jgi:hypothetical protein
VLVLFAKGPGVSRRSGLTLTVDKVVGMAFSKCQVAGVELSALRVLTARVRLFCLRCCCSPLSTCTGPDKTNLTFRKHLFPVLLHHSMAIIIIIPFYARHRDRILVSKQNTMPATHSHPEREVGVSTRVLATVAERVHVVRRSSFP